MSLAFIPTGSIYRFDEEEGTFTLTDEQKTILNNDDLIVVGYDLMVKEYDATYTTTTTIGDDYIELVKSKVSGSDVPYFQNKTYKLTFTSTTYTLTKI